MAYEDDARGSSIVDLVTVEGLLAQLAEQDHAGGDGSDPEVLRELAAVRQEIGRRTSKAGTRGKS